MNMKAKRMMLFVLLSLLVAAIAVGTCFAHGQAQQTMKEPRTISVQGKIEYMDMLGGYYVRGVKPSGEWMILNQNPEALKGYMDSKKTLTIEGTARGTERITITKIDGKEYAGTSQGDVKKYPSCKYCGMDREKFAHSRMLIEYTDGTAVGTCSIHCAAVDLALNIDKSPKAVMVGDYSTTALIDAEKAMWVLGGSPMGVMTRNAKWAFLQKGDAEKFIGLNGGKLGTYDEAMKAAYEDMYADTKMIREKRKMRMMEHKH
jgi:nitrous oxide reductase accessory protein NosL